MLHDETDLPCVRAAEMRAWILRKSVPNARKRFLPFKKDTKERMDRSHVGRMGLYPLHRRLWDGRGNDGKSTFPPELFYPKQPNEQLRVDTAARPAQGCIVLLRVQ